MYELRQTEICREMMLNFFGPISEIITLKWYLGSLELELCQKVMNKHHLTCCG